MKRIVNLYYQMVWTKGVPAVRDDCKSQVFSVQPNTDRQKNVGIGQCLDTYITIVDVDPERMWMRTLSK
jgi:hypothetical protein